ncbi:MAG: aminotransferase class III-fold pyridoxal phosphate-dependent enzyme, partial [Clostridia bacterium]|nr:aminotransferase class III-fold pyridoxal phosphate-dependent enzyme [Clostridia bacterium]
MNIIETDEKYLAKTYKRFPVALERGSGSLVYDANGREYVDFGTGIAVSSFGVSDPVWLAAVTEQAGKLSHTSNLYYHEPCARLAEMLAGRTGMKRVFFSNSGAEANECAIKTARKYSEDRYGSGRYDIVTLENSFHGRTLATLAATGQDHYHELFRPMPEGFTSLPAGDLDGFRKAASEGKTCAFMIELIQGEGGVVPMDPGFVKGLEAICAENDILLIVDEVQTGNGRTGELYCYMNYGIKPDIVTTAKGLAGGLPLGAVLFGEKTELTLGYGEHGSTFGANPICCAAAISILSRIDDRLLAEVRQKGELVRKSLEGAEGIDGVTGMGLMIGVKTKAKASEVAARCI